MPSDEMNQNDEVKVSLGIPASEELEDDEEDYDDDEEDDEDDE